MTFRRDLLNPTLAKTLITFGLDKNYVKGQGSYLYDDQGIKYLDFIAQYGAVPFGYNPDAIWQALEYVRQQSIPSLVQPSLPGEALRLANILAQVTPGELCYATFCQSGTEAVETAIKLARSATGKMGIISTYKSFHGKTLGALSATGREIYQAPFGAPLPDFHHIPYNDAAALADLLANNDNIAAFIVEPVQGEGGIIPAAPGYLTEVGELCRKYGVVFIVDEIQTGLGRTGYLFACEKEGIKPDIMLLAKALGGGLIPLGVCLSTPGVYNSDFGSLHSSTFANNNVSCAVGCAVMEYLLADDRHLVKEAKAKGDYLLHHLNVLAREYSDIIDQVRGEGLMLGIEFKEMDDCGSFDMAYLCEQGGFAGLLAGYLLNVHHIRLAPFLNNPMTVRLEPTLTITYEEIDYVLKALDKICQIISLRDYSRLYRYVLGDYSIPTVIDDYRPDSHKIICSPSSRAEKEKFAFIIHYPAPEDIIVNNPSFAGYTREELYQFLKWQSQIDKPGVVCHMPCIRSKNGAEAEGWFIGVPLGAREIMNMPRDQVVEMIGKGVDLAKDLGAKIVGLGALTSVVTRGGRSVQGRGVAITSGNSFTTLMAVEALFAGAKKMQTDLTKAQGAVLGATGSIGRACSLIMSEEITSIILLGNADHAVSSGNRLNSLIADMTAYAFKRRSQGILRGLSAWLDKALNQLKQSNDADGLNLFKQAEASQRITRKDLEQICKLLRIPCPLTTSLSLEDTLPKCNLIIAASNSPEYLVYPHHLSPGTIVCDVARPADVAPEVYEQRSDVLILEGGLVQYPDDISFGPNLGYRRGVNLACLSETVLLALEGDYQDYSIGTKLPLETVNYLRGLGTKHGFSLAGLMMGNKEITEQDINHILRLSQSLSLNQAQNL